MIVNYQTFGKDDVRLLLRVNDKVGLASVKELVDYWKFAFPTIHTYEYPGESEIRVLMDKRESSGVASLIVGLAKLEEDAE